MNKKRLIRLMADFSLNVAKASERIYKELINDVSSTTEEIEKAKEKMIECTAKSYMLLDLLCHIMEEERESLEAKIWRLEGGMRVMNDIESEKQNFSLKELNKHLLKQ